MPRRHVVSITSLFFLVGFNFSLLLTWSAPSFADSAPDPKRILDFVTSLVFFDMDNHLLRWERPIHYSVLSSNEGVIRELDRHFANLSLITGLSISRSQAEGANFVVVIDSHVRKLALGKYKKLYQRLLGNGVTPEIEMKMLRNQGGCFYSLGVDTANIESAIIFADEALSAGDFKKCVSVNTVRMLGILNVPEDERMPSIFQRNTDLVELSKYDEIVLRALYDHRIYSLITPEKAEEILTSLIR